MCVVLVCVVLWVCWPVCCPGVCCPGVCCHGVCCPVGVLARVFYQNVSHVIGDTKKGRKEMFYLMTLSTHRRQEGRKEMFYLTHRRQEGRKEMFYLTTLSTHRRQEERKEGNVLFNDAFNTSATGRKEGRKCFI